MPMQSQAQRRYLWAVHPDIARRFEDHTPEGAKLPEKKKKPVSRATPEEPAQKQATLLRLAEMTGDPDVISRVASASESGRPASR